MLNFLSKTLNVFKSNTSQVVTKDVLLDALLEADVSIVTSGFALGNSWLYKK